MVETKRGRIQQRQNQVHCKELSYVGKEWDTVFLRGLIGLHTMKMKFIVNRTL